MPTILFSAALLAVAILLAWWQQSAWRDLVEVELGEQEEAFLLAQHRRRMTVAVLVALLGAALPATAWITDPLWLGVYTWCLLGVVVAITVLAIVDFAASRSEYVRLAEELRHDRAELHRQVREWRQRGEFDEK
jgi:signal transduction histidine kinase